MPLGRRGATGAETTERSVNLSLRHERDMGRIEGKRELLPRLRRVAERQGGEAQPVTVHVENDAMRVALPLNAFDATRERVGATLAFQQAQLVRAHAQKAIRAWRQAVRVRGHE